MQKAIATLAGMFIIGMLAGLAVHAQADGRALASTPGCGASSAAQLRTTLYLGLGRPKGSVSELEWQLFVRDHVTTRFPQGLTVWDAEGQWQSQGAIDHERSKVLLLVHPDTKAAQASIQELIAQYRKAFDQESVLWETARVCAAM